MGTEPNLSSHLLALDPRAVERATTHPFLAAAANGSLPKNDLKAWLAQDRLYAMAYTNFIGQLLAQVPVPAAPDRRRTLEWRLADMFIDCLTNIRAELNLFEDTAAAEGFLDELGVRPSLQTRAYQDLFAGASAPSKPLLVGLTVLWATEACYSRAWTHAKAQMNPASNVDPPDVMQRVFIPNWTSPEFGAFVQRIESLLNEYGRRYRHDDLEWVECESAFRQVLEAEKRFWPVDGNQA